MCTFGLKITTFLLVIGKESPKCTEGGGSLIPKIYHFLLLPLWWLQVRRSETSGVAACKLGRFERWLLANLIAWKFWRSLEGLEGCMLPNLDLELWIGNWSWQRAACKLGCLQTSLSPRHRLALGGQVASQVRWLWAFNPQLCSCRPCCPCCPCWLNCPIACVVHVAPAANPYRLFY